MRWGIRRYQNRDGTLTPAGKERLANKGIRTEENLVEKTIPKGTKMYRTTPYEKDNRNSKSMYVTHVEADRNLYKEGSIVRGYVDKKSDEVYEHTYELKADIRVPSLKTMREIEREVVSKNVKLQTEIGKAYITSRMLADDGYTTVKDVTIMSDISKKLDTASTLESRRAIYKEVTKKYGDFRGDEYYHGANSISRAREHIDSLDSLTIEQSLGRAESTKQGIIKELQKRGYNAMYDNAGIGVGTDGRYSKQQEGVEPLIIFDANVLRETSNKRVSAGEQKIAKEQYENWKKERDETLRKFQD